MGIDPRTLSPQQRQLAGIRVVRGHVAAQLGHALRGYVRLTLNGEPPRTTHHSKVIGMRRGKRTLMDSPLLVRAREWYESRIPARAGITVPPLLSPVVMSVRFCFGWPEGLMPAGGGEIYCDQDPDLDNALKTLTDVLAMRGYVDNDKRIAKLRDVEKRYSDRPRVDVYLRTLTSSLDPGHHLPVHDDYKPGELWPLMFQAAEDTRHLNAPDSAAVAAAIGVPGGGKRTDEGRNRRKSKRKRAAGEGRRR